MEKQPLVTVFTPTYNRKKLLKRTYESMRKQTNKDFIWLIVDDGSSDGTEEMVRSWMQDNNGFELQYLYKQNGGMHTAHNTAYDNIHTVLNTCIDSDDLLAPDAIEIIYETWEIAKKYDCAGIVGLDADFTGKIIGCGYPVENKCISFVDASQNGVYGDKKLVYRTDIVNKYPRYPVYEGEKYGSLGYLYWLIDKDYPIFAINKVLCNVEYQPDGSSKNIWKQYYKNPKGYVFIRKFRLEQKLSIKRCLMEATHYVSSSILAKEKHIVKNSPKKTMTAFVFPLGVILCGLTIIKGKG